MQDVLNNKPLVSIVVPAYNAEKFIAQTIDSVKAQTYTNWELIIVNDGSLDNTLNIIEYYTRNDPRISCITKQNTGVSDTRNTGIEKAKGDLIALLDADDVWLPTNLEKKVLLLEKESSVDFVFSNMLQADKDLQNQTPAPEGKDENILEDLLLWNGEVIPGPCSNLVIRKKCFDSGIRFNKKLTTIADQNLTVQLAFNFSGKLIKENLWVYRILPGSMSKSLRVMEEDALATYSIYKENNYFRSAAFMRKCFSNMYLIVGASWWKDGNKKLRGLYFLMLAFFTAPLNTLNKLIQKISR